MHADDSSAGRGRDSDRMRVTAIILTVVGLVWWVAGVAAPGRVTGVPLVTMLGAGLALTVLLAALCSRELGVGDSAELFERNRRTFNRVNALQGVGIAVVVAVGAATGNGAYIPALVALVVGLHFVPFVRAFRWAGWGWLSAAFVVAALVGCGLAATGRPPEVVGGVVAPACAVACWTAVVLTLVHRRHLARSAVGASTSRP